MKDIDKIKLEVKSDLSYNIGKRINTELVDYTLSILDNTYSILDNTYSIGVSNGVLSELEKSKESFKKISDTIDETKDRLKSLVKDVRREQDNMFSKDVECTLEELLDAIERW